MMSFSTILLVMFMVIFWMFRAVVALCTQFSIDLIGIVAYNFNTEVIIAFLTLIAIILVIKRNMIGAFLYAVLYIVYFGTHFVSNIFIFMDGTISLNSVMNVFVDVVAIILAVCVFVDLIVEKVKRANPVDKKTDWYFKNNKYDEELNARDKREDKNEYKFY